MTTSATRSQFEVFKFYLALYGFHKKGGSEKFFLKGAATLKKVCGVQKWDSQGHPDPSS